MKATEYHSDTSKDYAAEGKKPGVMIVGWQVRFHAYDYMILMNFVLAFLDGFQQFI